MELLILIDFKKKFHVSLVEKEYTSMNISKLKTLFSKNGFDVRVIQFSELNMEEDYSGKYVIYQTSEEKGQYYKKYIEDIVYFLHMKGAHVLPKYEYLKSHHNKGFMELLRCNFTDQRLKSIKSQYYGNPYEVNYNTDNFPLIIKQNSGFGGEGVYCATGIYELQDYINKSSKVIFNTTIKAYIVEQIKNKLKAIVGIFDSKYIGRITENTVRPFIIQNYIEGLDGDYKVLYFGGKYYTLYRKNREGDFRASGGGRLFEVPIEEITPLLNFAEKVVNEINYPIIGMDICFDGSEYHLIEFQMIHLGPYTLQKSESYFIRNDTTWTCIHEKSDLEIEYVRSIVEFIGKKFK